MTTVWKVATQPLFISDSLPKSHVTYSSICDSYLIFMLTFFCHCSVFLVPDPDLPVDVPCYDWKKKQTLSNFCKISSGYNGIEH